MRKILFVILVALSLNAVQGQERDPAYVETISKRVDGNMQELEISDEEIYGKVKAIIVNHYYTLYDLDAERDSLQRVLRQNPESGITPEFIAANKDAKLYRHHFSFVAELMMYLSNEQIETVKNALTYNVVRVTYNSYLGQNPNLNEFQKWRIYVWLTEARELAISGGSSNEKHGIFNKYKGKINNFLSAERKNGNLN